MLALINETMKIEKLKKQRKRLITVLWIYFVVIIILSLKLLYNYGKNGELTPIMLIPLTSIPIILILNYKIKKISNVISQDENDN